MFFACSWRAFADSAAARCWRGHRDSVGHAAVTAMLALATTIGDRIHKELAVYGANIIVYPKADLLEVKVGGVDVKPASGGAYLKESDLQKLRDIFWANNILGVSPELQVNQQAFPAGAGAPSISVTVVGLWFDHDFGSMKTGAADAELHPAWKLEEDGRRSQGTSLLAGRCGRGLCEGLNLHVGGTFELPRDSQLANGGLVEAQVTGIVSTGNDTDSAILVPLPVAQAMANKPDAISRVEISARTKPEDAFARRDPDSLSPGPRDLVLQAVCEFNCISDSRGDPWGAG